MTKSLSCLKDTCNIRVYALLKFNAQIHNASKICIYENM